MINDSQDASKHIKSVITNTELNHRLEKETLDGKLLGAEHCFQESSPWYHLNVGYTNPINFGLVHAELLLIAKNMEEENNPLGNALINRCQAFYGVGVGDTEMAFVDWAIKKGQKENMIIGIDVNKDFLENYIIALRNRTFEPDTPHIYFIGHHALFEQIVRKDLHAYGLPPTHICLGGTIGNFLDQEEIAKMFSDRAIKDEYLILGVQLDSNIDYLFQKYVNNSLYAEFVLNYIIPEKRKPLSWELNKATGVITAIHEGVEVFRTTKYNPKNLQDLIENVNFRLEYQTIDRYENSCIQLYKKL